MNPVEAEDAWHLPWAKEIEPLWGYVNSQIELDELIMQYKLLHSADFIKRGARKPGWPSAG